MTLPFSLFRLSDKRLLSRRSNPTLPRRCSLFDTASSKALSPFSNRCLRSDATPGLEPLSFSVVRFGVFSQRAPWTLLLLAFVERSPSSRSPHTTVFPMRFAPSLHKELSCTVPEEDLRRASSCFVGIGVKRLPLSL